LLAYLHNSADQPSGAARLGQYAFSQGDHALALSWYRKALEWDKFSPALYSDMAMIQNTAGQQRAALDTLSLGRTNIPTEPQFPYMMGLLHAELGEPERAEEGFRDATRLEPNFARAWYNLGLLLAGQERLDDAAAHLAKAADAEPRNPDYPFALATVEIRRGDREAARAAAGRALAIDPGHQGTNALLRSLEGPPPR
jgi:tetratricopeptide (TPR) repeat protein